MKRTLAIILFVLLLVGLGHIYHNNSLKEGVSDQTAFNEDCMPLDVEYQGRYNELRDKIHLRIDRMVNNQKNNFTAADGRAAKAEEHMMHIYKKGIEAVKKARRQGMTSAADIRNSSPLFNDGLMGIKEVTFIMRLIDSIESRI